MKVGDRVRIIAIPDGLPDDDKLRTKSLFALCLGRTFPIAAFQGELQWLELHVGEVVGGAAFMHTIWIERELVERADASD